MRMTGTTPERFSVSRGRAGSAVTIAAFGILCAACRPQLDKIPPTIMNKIRTVAIVYDVGNGVTVTRISRDLLELTETVPKYYDLNDVFRADIDIVSAASLAQYLRPHYDVSGLVVDYVAMREAARRIQERGTPHSRDDVATNTEIVRAAVGSYLQRADAPRIDAYLYVYPSGPDLNIDGGAITSPGVTLFGTHYWKGNDHYQLCYCAGILMLDETFQPLRGPVNAAKCVKIDGSYWIGPPIEHPMPAHWSGAVSIDAAQRSRLQDLRLKLAEQTAETILRASGFVR